MTAIQPREDTPRRFASVRRPPRLRAEVADSSPHPAEAILVDCLRASTGGVDGRRAAAAA